MKKFVVLVGAIAALGFVSSANAADLPIKAPIYKAAPMAVYNWGGWYVGGNVGYGWGTNSDPDVTFFDGSGIGVAPYFAFGGNVMPNVQQKGVLGGLQLGYNWMLTPNFVAGLVADIQASGMKASGSNVVTPCLSCATSTQTNSVETDWFGTFRAKLGLAQNNWLFYATGGLAYGQVKSSGIWAANIGVNYAGSVSSTRAGWAAGAGVDYGLTPNWTVGVEYLYVDLGRVSYTDVSTNGTAPLTTFTISNRATANIARATLNYKF
jgi:outer membrane immunogenic protein